MQLADGYLVVLPRDEAKAFFGYKEDQPRLDFLNELLAKDEAKKLGCQGKWQSLHDAFAAASIEDSVLGQCILGGRPLHRGDDYHVCLVRPDVVRFIADQGAKLAETDIDAALWDSVQSVIGLYKEAAELRGAMVFVAKTS